MGNERSVIGQSTPVPLIFAQYRDFKKYSGRRESGERTEKYVGVRARSDDESGTRDQRTGMDKRKNGR
jgi:hypothetical protein